MNYHVNDRSVPTLTLDYAKLFEFLYLVNSFWARLVKSIKGYTFPKTQSNTETKSDAQNHNFICYFVSKTLFLIDLNTHQQL